MELLSPDSKNFLDSGLSLNEFMTLYQTERLAECWYLQNAKEKQRRLRFVIDLSIELASIRKQTNFATAWAEWGIEAVIEGNWKDVAMYAESFTFANESGEWRTQAADTYARFRDLLLQAHTTRPEAVGAQA